MPTKRGKVQTIVITPEGKQADVDRLQAQIKGLQELRGKVRTVDALEIELNAKRRALAEARTDMETVAEDAQAATKKADQRVAETAAEVATIRRAITEEETKAREQIERLRKAADEMMTEAEKRIQEAHALESELQQRETAISNMEHTAKVEAHQLTEEAHSLGILEVSLENRDKSLGQRAVDLDKKAAGLEAMAKNLEQGRAAMFTRQGQIEELTLKAKKTADAAKADFDMARRRLGEVAGAVEVVEMKAATLKGREQQLHTESGEMNRKRALLKEEDRRQTLRETRLQETQARITMEDRRLVKVKDEIQRKIIELEGRENALRQQEAGRRGL